ncbi:MAG: tetratricopeptide repeat protein [Candidatus Rokubacteria bacterium]|nr:tetratricopeptide repeat protein [Candidatus Rokubacteria bacterium]
MTRSSSRSFMVLTLVAGLLTLAWPAVSTAAVKPRTVLVAPFDTSALTGDERWIGEGVTQLITLGLTQHPAFIMIDRARLKTFGQPEAWGDAPVTQAARALHADVAIFGRVERTGTDLTVRPRLLESRGQGAPEATALEPITIAESDLLQRAAALPVAYARTLKITLTDAETARIEKAARPTTSLKAFELFARSTMASLRGGQEGNESAADLLSRAIEADPNFVVAQYTLGVVHQALGNRWKAAAQYRASTQLDSKYPEPYKALGDLFLGAPRRPLEQAMEAYGKAIELRPFYAEAHVGLGDARAAKGEIDAAVTAYQKALTYNPLNPRVHMSLGKIYYAEKGLYYESVQAYKKAIDLDPGSIEARMGLGEVYEDKGLYREAIEEYRHVIELDGKHTGAIYNMASVYEKVDPKEAIVQWERYIALASQLPSEKDWVDVARQHLRKLKSQVKD